MHPIKPQDQLEMFQEWKQAVAGEAAAAGEVVEEVAAKAVEVEGVIRQGKFQNRVDISDLNRNFTNEEWKKLPEETTQQIREAQEAAKAKKRNIAAASTNQEEDHAENDNETEEPVTSIEVRFGSGAYSSEKRAAKAWKTGSS